MLQFNANVKPEFVNIPFFPYVYLYDVYMNTHTGKPEQEDRFTRIGVTGGYELSDVSAWNSSSILQESIFIR